jgi:hypothetical protein
MRSEMIRSVQEQEAAPNEWPDYWLETDAGHYLLDLVNRELKPGPEGHQLRARNILPPELAGQRIVDVRRSDEPVIVVELQDGSKLVFEVSSSPFTEQPWPTLDVQSREQSMSWQDEYFAMKSLWNERR